MAGAAGAKAGIADEAVSPVAHRGHPVGGADRPRPVVLIGVAALVWPVTTAFVGRRLRPAGLAAAVVVAQAALHVVFAFTSGVVMPNADALHHAGAHQHDQILLDSAGAVAQVMLPDAAMLTAHALAAVASFVLLFGGERMLRTIAAWTLRLLARATVSAPPAFLVPRATFADMPALYLRTGRGVVHRRGPPLQWGDVSVA